MKLPRNFFRLGISNLKFPVIFWVALLPCPLLRAQTLTLPHPHTLAKLIWEPEAEIVPGVFIPGFCRPAERRGYAWVEAHYDEYERYHPGYWKPKEAYLRPEGAMVWVPGYWLGEIWVPGYWRIPRREGYVWSEGYYDENGRWHEPHWRKSDPYALGPEPVIIRASRLSRAPAPRWGYKESLPP